MKPLTHCVSQSSTAFLLLLSATLTAWVSASVSNNASQGYPVKALLSVDHYLTHCVNVYVKTYRYVRSIAPKAHPPRWLVSIALNRFVDQDTYLLATQQSVTLSNELRDIADKQQPAQLQQPQASDAQASDRQRADGEAAQAGAPMARRSWYCHRSPTDNILVASGKWMDKAVPWMPNRYQGLLSSSLQGAHLALRLGLVALPVVSARQLALLAFVKHLCCPGCTTFFKTVFVGSMLHQTIDFKLLVGFADELC